MRWKTSTPRPGRRCCVSPGGWAPRRSLIKAIRAKRQSNEIIASLPEEIASLARGQEG